MAVSDPPRPLAQLSAAWPIVAGVAGAIAVSVVALLGVGRAMQRNQDTQVLAEKTSADLTEHLKASAGTDERIAAIASAIAARPEADRRTDEKLDRISAEQIRQGVELRAVCITTHSPCGASR